MTLDSLILKLVIQFNQPPSPHQRASRKASCKSYAYPIFNQLHFRRQDEQYHEPTVFVNNKYYWFVNKIY